MLDDLLREALKSGADVELELCEQYGYTFKIDGEYVIDPDKQGMPHEMFDIPISWFNQSEALIERLSGFTNEGDIE